MSHYLPKERSPSAHTDKWASLLFQIENYSSTVALYLLKTESILILSPAPPSGGMWQRRGVCCGRKAIAVVSFNRSCHGVMQKDRPRSLVGHPTVDNGTTRRRIRVVVFM